MHVSMMLVSRIMQPSFILFLAIFNEHGQGRCEGAKQGHWDGAVGRAKAH